MKYLVLCFIFLFLVGCGPTEYEQYLNYEYQKKPIKALILASKGVEKKTQKKLIYEHVSQKADGLIEAAIVKCQTEKNQLDSVQSVDNFYKLNQALIKLQEHGLFVEKIEAVLPIIQRGYQHTKFNFINHHKLKGQQAWDQKYYRLAHKHWSLVKSYVTPFPEGLKIKIDQAKYFASQDVYVSVAINEDIPAHQAYYGGFPVGNWIQKDLIYYLQKNASGFLRIHEFKKKNLSKKKNTHVIKLYFDIRPAKESEKIAYLAANDPAFKEVSNTIIDTESDGIRKDSYNEITKNFAYKIKIKALIQNQQNLALSKQIKIQDLYYKDIIWQNGPQVIDTFNVSNIHHQRLLTDNDIAIYEKDILPIMIKKAAEKLAEKCLSIIDQEPINYQ